jgi:hypothetical protein
MFMKNVRFIFELPSCIYFVGCVRWNMNGNCKNASTIFRLLCKLYPIQMHVVYEHIAWNFKKYNFISFCMGVKPGLSLEENGGSNRRLETIA